MFTISKPSANRLDLALSGSLDAEAMKGALEKLSELSEGMSNGRLLYEVSDFEMPTLGALVVEFQKLPMFFTILGKFEKCAVVSEAEWIRSTAEIEGAMIPGLDIKAFAPSERRAAEDWLQAEPDDDGEDVTDENFPV